MSLGCMGLLAVYYRLMRELSPHRYNRTKIFIDDPAIADLKVGGTFVRTDPESFVTALGLTMGMQATTVPGDKDRDSRTIRLSGAETGP